MKPVFKNILAGAAILAAVALVPVTAPAYFGDDGPTPGGQHLKKMSKELQLTTQQKQQVKDIFEKSKPTAEPLVKQLRTERQALRSLIHADTIDEAAIRAQAGKSAAVQADLAVHRAHVAQEIRGVLTPDQVAKAKQIQAKCDNRMEGCGERSGKRSKKGR